MDHVAEGHCKGEGVGGGCAKLNLPPFYKVNGKLKRGPLQHYNKNTHLGPLPWRTYFSLAQLGGTGSSESLTLAFESVATVHVLDCQCSCMYALYQHNLYL